MSLSEEINAQSAEILELSESEGISQISYNDLVQSKLREKYDALVTGMLEKVEIEKMAKPGTLRSCCSRCSRVTLLFVWQAGASLSSSSSRTWAGS